MKKIANALLISFLMLISLSSVSHGEIDSRQTRACLRFYAPSEIKNSRIWHRPEPTGRAIGDGNEPKYTPKGFVKELKEAEVSNQCQTYECYLFSVINFINVYNKTKRGDDSSLISEPFLVAHKFLEHIKEGLRLGVNHPQLIHDIEGGFSYEAFHLTRTVGLVPRRSMKLTIPFELWDFDKIYRVLKKKVPEKHEILKSIANEFGWNSNEVKIQYAKFFDELKYVVLEQSGPLPTEFSFNGKRYDPHSWERAFGIPRLALLEINNKEDNYLPENYPTVLRQTMSDKGGQYRVLDGNYNSLVLSMKDYIDSNLPVILDLNWKNDGHSMLVVGYELNDSGNVVRFKFMNSWGKQFGNSGYAWYTVEDIWKNVTGTYRFKMAQ